MVYELMPRYSRRKSFYGKAMVEEIENKNVKDYKYITELVMVLNWKIYEHYESNNELAEIYNDLWEKLDLWAQDNLKGEELSYYYKTTD